MGKSESTFIGYSLGGGEAAAASMATGRNAITFNAAAVSPMTIFINNLGSSDHIINYRIVPPGDSYIRVGGCFVSNLQENLGLPASGKTITIKVNHHNPYTAHGIKNFVEYFKNKK